MLPEASSVRTFVHVLLALSVKVAVTESRWLTHTPMRFAPVVLILADVPPFVPRALHRDDTKTGPPYFAKVLPGAVVVFGATVV